MSNLPEQIILSTGEILKPVIGGHLDNKPFVNPNGLYDTAEREVIVNEARRRKLKYRRIGVLHRNLRGKLDLHGYPYRPNVWIFVETDKLSDEEIINE